MTELNKSKTRKKYDLEFRRRAVEHWLASGKTAVQIGQELGLDPTRLYAWRDSMKPSNPSAQGSRSREELEAEIAQLRRDNDSLRQQRDILKKTLGILSEPPSNATSGSKP
jgi:transposase